MEGGVLIVAILIGIGLLVATGMLASKKGRSVPLWIVLGILFNPIALIILLCLSNDSAGQSTRA